MICSHEQLKSFQSLTTVQQKKKKKKKTTTRYIFRAVLSPSTWFKKFCLTTAVADACPQVRSGWADPHLTTEHCCVTTTTLSLGSRRTCSVVHTLHQHSTANDEEQSGLKPFLITTVEDTLRHSCLNVFMLDAVLLCCYCAKDKPEGPHLRPPNRGKEKIPQHASVSLAVFQLLQSPSGQEETFPLQPSSRSLCVKVPEGDKLWQLFFFQ